MTLRILAAGLVAALLTGCSVSINTSKSPSANESSGDTEQSYLTEIRQAIPQMSIMSDTQVIRLGVKMCDAMASSVNSPETMIAFAGAFVTHISIITDRQALKYLTLTVDAYCPDKAQYLP